MPFYSSKMPFYSNKMAQIIMFHPWWSLISVKYLLYTMQPKHSFFHFFLPPIKCLITYPILITPKLCKLHLIQNFQNSILSRQWEIFWILACWKLYFLIFWIPQKLHKCSFLKKFSKKAYHPFTQFRGGDYAKIVL